MATIDRVYRTVQDVLNKEQRGYFTPEEFNNFAQLAQNEIFEQYFHDYNYFENAMKAGRTNSEFADIPKHFRERINLLIAEAPLDGNSLPSDLYRLTTLTIGGRLVEEEEHDTNAYAQLSPLGRSTSTRPTFTRHGNDVRITPTTTEEVIARYVRKPMVPKWTYNTLNGTALFNSGASDFQDFELHPAEEHELVLKILKYAGIHVGDTNVAQLADQAAANDNQQEFRV